MNSPDHQPRQGRLNWTPGFDPVAFWSRFEYPKWVVYLTGKKIGRKNGRPLYETDRVLVQARSEERDVACAKRYSLLKGRVHGFAQLAYPSDCGCTPTKR